MKFKARYLMEHEIVIEAGSALEAAVKVQSAYGCKMLGVIPIDQQWPDQESQTKPRPPRGAPPSGGSPGTPTASVPVVAHAVAA
jgi:hypothetical protein